VVIEVAARSLGMQQLLVLNAGTERDNRIEQLAS
jgi:hypothetical protein